MERSPRPATGSTASPGLDREERLRARAERAGQGHVFRYWDRLDSAGRERLLAELESLDFERVERLAELARGGSSSAPPAEIEPAELFPLRRDADRGRRAREAVEAGEMLLGAGQVGFLLVAGGQASRLGLDGPKGALRLGPVSGWSLFEIHARRLRAAGRRYGVATPWYVMTSRDNDGQTRRFFAEHAYFGLAPEDVCFFTQAMVPAMDFEGRVLMRAPDALFLAPNGHGGVLAAFADSGSLADARSRGLEQLSYFQVDNPLAPPADPLFLGLHVLANAGMSSKAVAKRDPLEKVGVFARLDGRLACIEYSDLPPGLRDAREPSGELAFRAGNIAIHALEVGFVGQLTRGGLDLPWHVARKRVKVCEDGREVEREGLKFETFVFDALGRSPSSVVLEVERAREFSPVKNARGEDSPETARADISRLHASWVAAAGRPLPPPGRDGVAPVEVDPLLAQDEASLAALGPIEPRITERGWLYT
jgi:UDP-N-acetylglucosamine/UDP-N-acetylgalactosamine diphosphorylase